MHFIEATPALHNEVAPYLRGVKGPFELDDEGVTDAGEDTAFCSHTDDIVFLHPNNDWQCNMTGSTLKMELEHNN